MWCAIYTYSEKRGKYPQKSPNPQVTIAAKTAAHSDHENTHRRTGGTLLLWHLHEYERGDAAPFSGVSRLHSAWISASGRCVRWEAGAEPPGVAGARTNEWTLGIGSGDQDVGILWAGLSGGPPSVLDPDPRVGPYECGLRG